MRYGLCLVNKGLENSAKENIIEILDDKKTDDKRVFDISKCCVRFGFEEYTELCRLSYLSQSVNRVLFIIHSTDFTDYDDLLDRYRKFLENSDKNKEFNKDINEMHSLISGVDSFRTKCFVEESELKDYSVEIEQEIGQLLVQNFSESKVNIKVNLKEPQIIFYIYINGNKAYLTIDFSSDISKRDYRIFNSSMSLKGTSAFGLLKIAKYSPKDHILNTFCNSGTIEIEAALYSNKIPVRFYNKDFPFKRLNIEKDISKHGGAEDTFDWDKFFANIDKNMKSIPLPITASDPLLRNLTASKKNAKVAGVDKFIDFRRIDIDWLDTKFKKKTVDKIMTFIPGSSKHKAPNLLKKLYEEFFYQAEYIIKDSGSVIVLCLSSELLIESSKKYFILQDQKEIYSGEQLMKILFFKKKKIDGRLIQGYK